MPGVILLMLKSSFDSRARPRRLAKMLLGAAVGVGVVSGDFGVDTSTWAHPWPQDSLECLAGSGSRFLIVEGYRTKNDTTYLPCGGHVVSTAPATIASARLAGFADVQLYHFPDTNLSAAAQITETLDFFEHSNITKLWLDVEGPQYWSADCVKNVAFITAAVAAARQRLGEHAVGIYSSMSQWQPITCGSTAFSDAPLWRPHYDGRPDNSDWDHPGIGPFGGWDAAAMKQYNGTAHKCGMDVDLDYRF
jgi:hypothetical protein